MVYLRHSTLADFSHRADSRFDLDQKILERFAILLNRGSKRTRSGQMLTAPTGAAPAVRREARLNA
jgi:hypothetical protein